MKAMAKHRVPQSRSSAASVCRIGPFKKTGIVDPARYVHCVHQLRIMERLWLMPIVCWNVTGAVGGVVIDHIGAGELLAQLDGDSDEESAQVKMSLNRNGPSFSSSCGPVWMLSRVPATSGWSGSTSRWLRSHHGLPRTGQVGPVNAAFREPNDL